MNNFTPTAPRPFNTCPICSVLAPQWHNNTLPAPLNLMILKSANGILREGCAINGSKCPTPTSIAPQNIHCSWMPPVPSNMIRKRSPWWSSGRNGGLVSEFCQTARPALPFPHLFQACSKINWASVCKLSQWYRKYTHQNVQRFSSHLLQKSTILWASTADFLLLSYAVIRPSATFHGIPRTLNSSYSLLWTIQ